MHCMLITPPSTSVTPKEAIEGVMKYSHRVVARMFAEMLDDVTR